MGFLAPKITAIESPYLSKTNTGLGNVLFQIASTYGLCKMLNKKYSFHRVKLYIETLKSNYNFNHGETILRNIPIRDANEAYTEIVDYSDSHIFNTSLIKQLESTDENILLHSYLESFDYFSDITVEIRNLFIYSPEMKKYLFQKHPLLNSETKTAISIHFRGSPDFLKNHHAINEVYYKNAIDYMKKNVSNPVFFIFSDTINCFNLNMFESSEFYMCKNDYDYEDLYTISLCKHNILSPSTFSWWGAFLNTNSSKLCTYDKSIRYSFFNLYTPL